MKIVIENKNKKLSKSAIEKTLKTIQKEITNFDFEFDMHEEKDLIVSIENSPTKYGVVLEIKENDILITCNIKENSEDEYDFDKPDDSGELEWLRKIEQWIDVKKKRNSFGADSTFICNVNTEPPQESNKEKEEEDKN